MLAHRAVLLLTVLLHLCLHPICRCTNGTTAQTVIVYAKTEPEKGPHGITAFIIEKGMPVGAFTACLPPCRYPCWLHL